MTKNERFKNVINFLKNERIIFNDADFAKILGKQKSYISDVKAGRKQLSEQQVHLIEDHFKIINGNWLLTGEGDMLKTGSIDSLPASQPLRQTELDFSVLLESNKNMSESVKNVSESISKMSDSNNKMVESNKMLADNNTKLMLELMQLIHDFKEVMGKLDMGAGGAGGVASGRKVG